MIDRTSFFKTFLKDLHIDKILSGMWLSHRQCQRIRARQRQSEDDIFEEAISAHVCVCMCTRIYLASLFASFWSGNDYVTRVRDTGHEVTFAFHEIVARMVEREIVCMRVKEEESKGGGRWRQEDGKGIGE